MTKSKQSLHSVWQWNLKYGKQ